MNSVDKVRFDTAIARQAKLVDAFVVEEERIKNAGLRSSAELRGIRYQLESNQKLITRMEISSLRASKGSNISQAELIRREDKLKESDRAILAYQNAALVAKSVEEIRFVNAQIGVEKMRNGSLFRSVEQYRAKLGHTSSPLVIADDCDTQPEKISRKELSGLAAMMGLDIDGTRLSANTALTVSSFEAMFETRPEEQAGSIDVGEFGMTITEQD